MDAATTVAKDEFFAGHPFALEVFDAVEAVLTELGPFSVRITTSQAAFRRRRTFAFVWMPGRYLARPTAEVVLSIDLGQHDDSSRFKEVAHPSARHWIHHLEVHDLGEIDEEVVAWLRSAADHAS